MITRRSDIDYSGETPFLSIIIPAFNESGGITETLLHLRNYLISQDYTWEIIVIDDGSNDTTAALVENWILQNPNTHLMQNQHFGKGYAVKTGMLAAMGQVRLMCDADLSMPVNLIEDFVDSYKKGSDITIGSREIEGSKRFGESNLRHLRGRIFNFWLKVIGISKFEDTQCGFKCFSAPVANFLFNQLEVEGFGFDVELMFIASKQKQVTIREIPIHWHHNINSKVRTLRDPFAMIRDSIRVKWKSIIGKYNLTYIPKNNSMKFTLQSSIYVVIPTYNEADNISELTDRLLKLDFQNLIILFVDDNSPDGTSELINKLGENVGEKKIQLIQRFRKSGLGTAYIEGFKKALHQGAEIIVQMDADLSHKPEYLTELINNLSEYDCVVGSRYILGGGLDKNWGFKRKALSCIANFGIRSITGLKIRDVTSGFKAYRSDALKKINFSRIRCNGFGFQAEVAFLMERQNFKVKEYPITFFERAHGDSKMSFEIIFEAILRLSTLRILNKIRKPTA